MYHRTYTPRRAGLRWRQDAPAYILDCFDSGGPGERYTVLFVPPERPVQIIPFLGMSGAPSHPQGVSMWGEFRPHEAQTYRYRFGYQRVKWIDLPAEIRAHAMARWEAP